MLNLLQQVDFLEDLALTELVLHILLFDGLDRDTLTSELVHAEGDFSEGALSDQFDEFVELESSRWQLIILRNVILDVADQFVSFFE